MIEPQLGTGLLTSGFLVVERWGDCVPHVFKLYPVAPEYTVPPEQEVPRQVKKPSVVLPVFIKNTSPTFVNPYNGQASTAAPPHALLKLDNVDESVGQLWPNAVETKRKAIRPTDFKIFIFTPIDA